MVAVVVVVGLVVLVQQPSRTVDPFPPRLTKANDTARSAGGAWSGAPGGPGSRVGIARRPASSIGVRSADEDCNCGVSVEDSARCQLALHHRFGVPEPWGLDNEQHEVREILHIWRQCAGKQVEAELYCDEAPCVALITPGEDAADGFFRCLRNEGATYDRVHQVPVSSGMLWGFALRLDPVHHSENEATRIAHRIRSHALGEVPVAVPVDKDTSASCVDRCEHRNSLLDLCWDTIGEPGPQDEVGSFMNPVTVRQVEACAKTHDFAVLEIACEQGACLAWIVGERPAAVFGCLSESGVEIVANTSYEESPDPQGLAGVMFPATEGGDRPELPHIWERMVEGRRRWRADLEP